MYLKIDLEDFWLDEDQDIESGLKNYVINKTVQNIWDKIKKKVSESIDLIVKKAVEKSLYAKINKLADEILKIEQVKNPDMYGDNKNEYISIVDYIKYKYVKKSGWDSPDKRIEKLAEEFAKEIKDRYDLMFASQLVAKMHNNGLLKEDVAKLILPQSTEIKK